MSCSMTPGSATSTVPQLPQWPLVETIRYWLVGSCWCWLLYEWPHDGLFLTWGQISFDWWSAVQGHTKNVWSSSFWMRKIRVGSSKCLFDSGDWALRCKLNSFCQLTVGSYVCCWLVLALTFLLLEQKVLIIWKFIQEFIWCPFKEPTRGAPGPATTKVKRRENMKCWQSCCLYMT